VAWPFSSVGAPNLDTGPGVDVPLVSTAVTANQAWLTGAHFSNTHATNHIVVTVTNTAGAVLNKFKVPPGGELPYEWAFRPALGVKWVASAVGLKGHIWGYE